MIKRIRAGIPGFDNLIASGIPEKDLVLLSGTCGAGKTVFGLGFICSAADKEHGIYVSFEEEIARIKSTAEAFGWDVDRLEKTNKVKFLKYNPYQLEDIIEVIENNIREIGATRVVIDSISAIGVYVKDVTELRRMILQVSEMLRKNNCTSILISETIAGKKSLSRFGVEEFVADGVILLHNMLIGGEYRRGLSVWKMRSTDHSRKIHPYKINSDGFTVYPEDTISFNPTA
ncbi:MAG TPA: ATPase domain-containing protein [archaeon]|nr:ATPase domain-containing protein [archaeon]